MATNYKMPNGYTINKAFSGGVSGVPGGYSGALANYYSNIGYYWDASSCNFFKQKYSTGYTVQGLYPYLIAASDTFCNFNKGSPLTNGYNNNYGGAAGASYTGTINIPAGTLYLRVIVSGAGGGGAGGGAGASSPPGGCATAIIPVSGATSYTYRTAGGGGGGGGTTPGGGGIGGGGGYPGQAGANAGTNNTYPGLGVSGTYITINGGTYGLQGKCVANNSAAPSYDILITGNPYAYGYTNIGNVVGTTGYAGVKNDNPNEVNIDNVIVYVGGTAIGNYNFGGNIGVIDYTGTGGFGSFIFVTYLMSV